MKSRRPALGLALAGPTLLLFASTAGCDFLESAQATVVVTGLVVKTPGIQVPGRFELEGETAATSFVGERASATSTQEPDPIVGAEVSLSYAGNVVQLVERTEARGLYAATSLDDDNLAYVGGAAYTFAARLPGERTSYGGTIRMAPTELSAAALTLTPEPETVIPGLDNAGVHPKSTALTLAWQSRQYGRYAYVSVWRSVPSAPDRPQLVYDNRPKTAGELLQFIAGTPPVEMTVPAETFDEDGVYAVVLFLLDKGDDLQPNTFLGSPILAGSGAVVLLAVGNPG